jgi:alginate production protein
MGPDALIRSNKGQRGNRLNRRLRTAAVGVICSTAFAVTFGLGPPVVADEGKIARVEGVHSDEFLVWVAMGSENVRHGDEASAANQTTEAFKLEYSPGGTERFGKIQKINSDVTVRSNSGDLQREPTSDQQSSENIESGAVVYLKRGTAETGVEQSTKGRRSSDATTTQIAQFKLPPQKPTPGATAPPKQLMQRLIYEYGYGSESEIVYRRNADLDRGVDDDSLILVPELNGMVTYRPTDWLETRLEMILAYVIPAKGGQPELTFATGQTVSAESSTLSLNVDQLLVTIKNIIDPFALTVGRRNFEDPRHWLYDTSLDVVFVSLKLGKFRAEASVGRERLVDLDLLDPDPADRINTYILYGDYRGIEDLKLAGYTIFRDDLDGQEGRPLLLGVRSLGRMSDEFSFWTELAILHGEDENSRKLEGYAFDVGGTYRFTSLPFRPNVTLGFALATKEFRQSGLESNETKFAGVSEFKIYGEVLDPELGNLKILTVGLGFRPSRSISIDFVYHRYWLYTIANEFRDAAFTALLNQDNTQLSKDVGSAVDVVLGFRNLFGLRRLGLDLRAGLFFPEQAFRIAQSDGSFRNADNGFVILFKLWW